MAIDFEVSVWVEFAEVLFGDGEHPARPTGRVVQLANDAFFGEHLVVFEKEEVDHQADDLAGREVLASGFVALLGKSADEFLKDVAHLQIRDAVGMQIGLGKPADDEIEQIVAVEAGDLFGQLEAVDENFTRIAGKSIDKVVQVRRDVLWVVEQVFKGEGTGVVEGVPAGLVEYGFAHGVVDGCRQLFHLG